MMETVNYGEYVRERPDLWDVRLKKLAWEIDSRYADSMAEWFSIDRALVLKARRLGRATALEFLAYGMSEEESQQRGQVAADSFRIVSCREEPETNKLLELAFLAAYTYEWFHSTEETASDVR